MEILIANYVDVMIRCPGQTWAYVDFKEIQASFLYCQSFFCALWQLVGVIILCIPLSPYPYPICQFLLHYLLALSRWVNEGVWQRSHVTVVAWALLQDSFHTTLSLHHCPHTIATAVLYLSLHCCKLEVPGGRFAQRQWWEVFSPGTSEQTLQDIACKIMSVSDMSQDSGSN